MPKSDNVTSVHVNDSGTWKIVKNIYRKSASGWQEVKDAWTRDNGSTVQFWDEGVISVHTLYAEPTPLGPGEKGFRGLPNNAFSGSITPSALGSTGRQITWLTTTSYNPANFRVSMSGTGNSDWNTVTVTGPGINISYDRSSMVYGSSGGSSSWHITGLTQFFTSYETYTVTFT